MKSLAHGLAAGAFAIALTVAVGASPARAEPYQTAVLRTLDKITARVATLTVVVGQPAYFGNLEIVARACDKTPPEDPPEATAFLEITEHQSDGTPKLLFTGWMLASSPGLSALEHPIYDVWVLDCVNTEDKAPPKSSDEG